MIRALAFIFSLLIGVFAFAGFQLKQLQTVQLAISEPVLYQVKSGAGVQTLCNDFKNKQWLESCFWLKVYARINPEDMALQQGLYQINKSTLLSTLTKINQGRTHQFAFTIVEGSTFLQVMAAFENAQYLELVNEQEVKKRLKALGISQENPEGWFFPETYYYSAGDTQLDILKRAYLKMKKRLESLWQQRDQSVPLASPYEALILASIIEKESGHDAERDLIASVFVNRLNKDMRLQTDPTVIYGLGDEYQGDIKSEHLRRLTPYNTYRINGLPPTPIAMPSEQAIYATLNPRYSDFYYFVASGNGQHYFSKTLKQHNAAVRKYILNK